MDTTGLFTVVNPRLLKEELEKYLCLDEKCMSRFARDSGISVTLMGGIDDMGDRIIITIRAFGHDLPYRGKVIYTYRVMVPIADGTSAKEFSYICEEHAGRFLSGMLKSYRAPVFAEKKDGRLLFPGPGDLNGRFELYRFLGPASEKNRMKDGDARYGKAGRVTLRNGEVADPGEIREGDFIFMQYPGSREFLDSFYYGRKKEISLSETTFTDTLYTILFTVPASATMPLAAPVLGYYKNSDWTGLMLWTVNAAPWLWMEYDGLMNSSTDLRDRRKDVESHRLARTRFAWYMVFTGGSSLFVDAFALQSLGEASAYQGKPPLLGSSFSAGYLSLISGGGGLFYRGYRSWGYLYFQLNNILLYYTLKEFSPGERYNAATGRYEKGEVHKSRAYRLAGAYLLLKTVEITHAVLARDRVASGEVIQEEWDMEPLAWVDESKKMSVGMRYVFRF